MPKKSRINPVHISKDQWLKQQNPPKGVLEGHAYGADVVVIRYAVDKVGEGPNLHMHPYDEIFHILEGTAEFTVGDKQFIAKEGDLVIGPANIPHAYKNVGPGRLDSLDIHLNNEWIQYDLPREGETLSAEELS
ncbi:cupin domain-containing protein [Winogradskyella sp.]|uniref:cupin domain-containing protein n=1 Tax=Winogradskyella sp. TaxID=1883156 RepID=UPI003BAD19D4